MKTSMQSALILALLIGPASGVPRRQARASNDPLGRRVRVLGDMPSEVKRESTTTFFLDSLIAAGNPVGGFATVQGCEHAEPDVQPLLPTDSTLGAELDKLVANDPGYTYTVDKGVVNLLPYQGPPPLLNARISVFDVEDESIEAPFFRLIGSAEVLQAKASIGITGTKKLQQFVGAQPAPPVPGRPKVEPKKFTLHLRNVTLMEALNSLVRAQGRGVWRYMEHLCDGEDWDWIDLTWR
jgi:hypothetical protein